MNWGSKIAITRLEELTKILGEPDWSAKEKGGNCGWNEATLKKKGLIFSELYIVDEDLRHTEPAPHCDCLYGAIQIALPVEDIERIVKVSKSMWYDQLKQHLVARCHFVGAVVGTLLAGVDSVLYDIPEKDLPSRYKEYIKKSMTKEGLTEQYQQLKDSVNEINAFNGLNSSESKKCDYSEFKVEPIDDLSVIVGKPN